MNLWSYPANLMGPVAAALIEIEGHRIEHLEEGSISRRRGDGDEEMVAFIFLHDRKPIAQNSVRNTFKRILTKAGLRVIRFHDIRHTFATLLLSNGESPVYVKDQLGRHSIQMTVDVYSSQPRGQPWSREPA